MKLGEVNGNQEKLLELRDKLREAVRDIERLTAPKTNKRPIIKLVLKTKFNDEMWEDAPFGWFRELQSQRAGDFGEEIVKQCLESLGTDVEDIGRGGDLLIVGKEAEVKTSTIKHERYGRGGHKVKVKAWFNQIRLAYNINDYYFVVVHPDKIEIYLLSRKDHDFSKLDEGHKGGVKLEGYKSLTLERDSEDKHFVCKKLGVEVKPIATFSYDQIGVSYEEAGK
jgi:hypothetical protein